MIVFLKLHLCPVSAARWGIQAGPLSRDSGIAWIILPHLEATLSPRFSSSQSLVFFIRVSQSLVSSSKGLKGESRLSCSEVIAL